MKLSIQAGADPQEADAGKDGVLPAKRRKQRFSKGRTPDPTALREVQDALGATPRRRDLLIEFLHRLQDRYLGLSASHLTALAHELGMSMAEVYEVASFYHHFDIVKDGEAMPPSITVRVCSSLSCQLNGAEALLQSLPALLGTPVRVQPVPCVGRCDSAPVVVVGQNPIGQADVERVQAAVVSGQTQATMPAAIDFEEYVANAGYATLRDCIAGRRSAEEVIATLEQSGLRGLGGAGFPAGRKWRIVRNEPAPRLMAVNIDEGEPGTFKDRHFLERDPHRFLEGMLIAAWAVGIAGIYIYLRDEYAGCRALLERELAALQRHFPDLPPIQLRRGAGAYICGEESAMIESIEGKRGMPRLRPPYVAHVGLFGRPTLEHNMETLFWVRDLIERGPQWFSGEGRNGRQGLRAYSVSGRVQRPGVHLAPAGISVRELIDEYCGGMQAGHVLKAYLPGGASGGILPASLDHVPLDFDTLQAHGSFIGSAAVIVLSDRDSTRAAALNLLQFFADESCGQCTPCRVGTVKAVELMRKANWDQNLLEELCATMVDASISGLGQAAPNPIRSVIKFFPQELA